MFETARYEARRRLRGTAGLVAILSVYVGFMTGLYRAINIEAYGEIINAVPASLREALGIVDLSVIEGWLAAEVYYFFWIWVLGIYFGYTAAGLITDDIEHDRLDLLLSFPFSRSRLLLEKFSVLFVPLLALNSVVPVVVYSVVSVIGGSVDPIRLLMVHLLSIPFLLACAAIGIGLSVLVDRPTTAQRLAMAVVSGLFLFQSLVATTDFAWVGAISPKYYFDPAPILLEGTYDLGAVGVLLVATVVLLLVSQWQFKRRDIG